MPALTDEAFMLLEHSFNDQSLSRKLNDLATYPGQRPKTDMAYSVPPKVDNPSAAPTDTLQDDNVKVKTLQQGRREFPPTPPSPSNYDRESRSSSRNSPSGPKVRAVTPVHSHHPPPTPDITPPHTRQKLTVPRPQLSHSASSQADSFVTAREDLQSNASTGEGQWNLGDMGSTGFKSPSIEDGHLHNSLFAYIEQMTPTKKRADPFLEQQEQSVDEIAPRPLDHESMRNVTVRKIRHKGALNHVARSPEALRNEKANDVRYKSFALGAKEEATSEQNTTYHEPPEASDWHRQINDMLYTHMRDEKSKRLSGTSVTSTTIEAVVLVNPIPKRRALRHAGKNLALRDEADCQTQSRRASSESNDSGPLRLRHKPSPLPARQPHEQPPAANLGAQWILSSPETGTRELGLTDQVRSQCAVPSSTSAYPVSQKIHHSSRSVADKMHVDLRTSYGHAIVPESNVRSEQVQQNHAKLHSYHHLESVASNVDKSRFKPAAEAAKAPVVYSNPISPQLGSWKDSGWSRYSVDKELLSPGETDEIHAPGSIPSSTLDWPQAQKLGFDAWPNSSSTHLSPFMTRRGSLEPRMDHASARQVNATTTPLSMSQLSDRTDTLEVNEATAVNLYQHNNNSLVLVQQRASQRRRSDPVDSQQAFPSSDGGSGAKQGSLRPIFTAVVRSSTPPRDQNYSNLDSPLTNPRPAPEPPSIKFIPPTPNDEMDRQLGDAAMTKDRGSKDGALIRRMSLVERARRYSESFVQPFLVRTGSLNRRRRYTGHLQEGERPTNLHPSWRPRGFWDEFDSEDDDDDFDEPLPSGGDTTDVGEVAPSSMAKFWSPRKMSVRMPGFRGSGGFLVGNSLGLGRHGTNNRRHYVEPPSSQEKVIRRRKSEHMLRILGASTNSLRQRNKRQRIYMFPRLEFQVEYVGVRSFADRMRHMKSEKQERALEKRREKLRRKIGNRVYHHHA